MATARIRNAIHVMTISSDAFHRNSAASLIWALRTFELGQLFAACHAMVSNVSRVKFGTLARSVNPEQLMR